VTLIITLFTHLYGDLTSQIGPTISFLETLANYYVQPGGHLSCPPSPTWRFLTYFNSIFLERERERETARWSYVIEFNFRETIGVLLLNVIDES